MKKLFVILLLSIFLTQAPNSAYAADSCDLVLNKIPKKIGSQTTAIQLSFTGFNTTENAEYELRLNYREPVFGRTGQVGFNILNMGELKTKVLGTLDSPSFLVTKFENPEAFFMDGNLYHSDRSFTIVQKNSNGPTLPCGLGQYADYDVYSSAISNLDKACGDGGTTGNSGEAGGCIFGYMCKTAPTKGWWCENSDGLRTPDNGETVVVGTAPEAPVVFVDPNTGGTTQTGSSTQTGSGSTQTGGTTQPGGNTQTGSNTQYIDDSQTGGNANSTGIPAGANRTDTTTNTDSTSDEDPGLDVFNGGPTESDFAELNPLKNSSAQLKSPGGIVSRALQFAFPLAGLILFIMIVWGGFEMLIGATGKGIEAGRQRVTNAIIGFLALFVAYWVFQIIEYIFKIQIL